MKLFFHALMILATLAGAWAIPVDNDSRDYFESRIFGLEEFYFANWTETGTVITDVNDTRLFGGRSVRGLYFYTAELDPHMAMFTQIIDNKTFAVKLEENPDDPYPFDDAPITLCALDNNTVKGGDRFEVKASRWCELKDDTTVYVFPRLIFDRWFTVEFNEQPAHYKIWFGGDIIPPQGGSSGLPSCETVSGSMSVNQTNVTIGSPFQMNISAFGLPVDAGCSIIWFKWQKNHTPFNLIPTNSDGTSFNCTGVFCQENNPSLSTKYTRNPTCEKVGDQVVRGRLRWTSSLGTFTTSTVERTITCNVPVVAGDDGGGEEFFFVILWLILLMVLNIKMVTMVRKRRRKNAER